MFESMSGEDAKTTLTFLFEASIDIELENDPHMFIEKVLIHTRRIFGATAGSISLIDGNQLQFLTLQNDEVDITQCLGQHHHIPLNKKSIAGYVALTGEMLEIDDAYHIPKDAPYQFDNTTDQHTGFKTESILAIPLHHPVTGIIGTLEILNPKSKKFDSLNIGMAKSFSVLASVNIINMRLQESLMKAYLDTLTRLGHAAEYKDSSTFQHIQRIRYVSKIIARELGFSSIEQENIFHASAMHDVGKVSIPDAILGKRDKLEPDEWEIMKGHAAKGATILSGSENSVLQMSETIALYHHEKWNGYGYPKGLKGSAIPMVARIVAIADVFDALLQKRPYKKSWPLQDALDFIRNERGEHFDPKVVDAFFACKKEIVKIQKVHGATIIENSK